VGRIRDLEAGQGEALRNAIRLEGVSLDDFGLAALAFEQDPTDEAITEASQPARAALERAATSRLVEMRDNRVHVKATAFERSYINFSVLASQRHEAEDVRVEALRDPGLTLAVKTAALFDDLATKRVPLQPDCQVVSQLFRSEARDANPLWSLIWDAEESYGNYTVRVAVESTVPAKWTITLFLATEEAQESVREVFEEELRNSEGKLRRFGVQVIKTEVEGIDAEQLENAKRTAGDPDPVDAGVLEAMDAFVSAKPNAREQVTRAATLALDDESPILDPSLCNNLAFMLASSEGGPLYEIVSDRALQLAPNNPMTLLTRALWEAARGDYASAKGRVNAARNEMRESSDPSNTYMYSPAALAREPAEIQYDDLVAGLTLSQVFDPYEASIDARAAGRSVAECLAGLPDQSRWVLLAAARAADFEGANDFAHSLRQQAAEIAFD